MSTDLVLDLAGVASLLGLVGLVILWARLSRRRALPAAPPHVHVWSQSGRYRHCTSCDRLQVWGRADDHQEGWHDAPSADRLRS